MPEPHQVPLSNRDRQIIIEALIRLKHSRRTKSARPIRLKEIDLLVSKFLDSAYPDITIGVHGGQVQWVLGNPFPIRVCDYDGDRDELPDVDERGQKCRMWFEPVDSTTAQS